MINIKKQNLKSMNKALDKNVNKSLQLKHYLNYKKENK